MAAVIVNSRVLRSVSRTAGRVASATRCTEKRKLPFAASRWCTASPQTHGSITASGPTKPIGPLQRTAKPMSPPTTAARATVRRPVTGPVVAERSGRNISAISSVAQVVSAVRIESGVAACDSMPTSRQPTYARAAITPVVGLNQRVPARKSANAVASVASAAGRRAAISDVPKRVKHAAMHQCMSTGLSTASVSLYIGTTQLPVSSMVWAIAANRGSSSSQNGVAAKPTVRQVMEATSTTASGLRMGMRWIPGERDGRCEREHRQRVRAVSR